MSHKWKLIMMIVLSLVFGETKVQRGYSLSLVSMIPLLELESKLIDNLDNYAKELEQKVQMLRRQTQHMRVENGKGNSDAIAYLSNPLNSLSLIRRLNQDWVRWRKYMEQSVGIAQIRNFDDWKRELPTKWDSFDACEGVVRIQRAYDLRIKDVVKGKLKIRQYNVSMSSADTFAVGYYLFKENKPSEAMEWLQEVYDQEKVPTHLAVEKVELLKLLGLCYANKGDYFEAQKLLTRCQELRPHDSSLLLLTEIIKNLVKTPQENKTQLDSDKMKWHQDQMATSLKWSCSNEFGASTRLHCTYNSSTNPFLRLAPLKMEQIGWDPYMVLYHDVLSAQEISQLKNIDFRSMKTTTVAKTIRITKNVRTGKSQLFKKETNALTKRIKRLISDISGFDLSDSESLQVINYGIGGHYDLHCDYFNFSGSNWLGHHTRRSGDKSGDRIASVLFYLSDVEQGGATVFPRAGYSIKPRAGTVLFWYNLHTDGTGDPSTMHAACPVIVGSKWVMTQWIREWKQILTRPCLNPAPPMNDP